MHPQLWNTHWTLIYIETYNKASSVTSIRKVEVAQEIMRDGNRHLSYPLYKQQQID